MNGHLSISRMAYRTLFHALELLDYDTCKFSSETGVDLDFTSNFDDKVPVQDYYQAWQEAARLTGEPLIGLAAGANMHPGNIGALGYSMMNCETTGDALRLFFRYQHMDNRSIHSYLDEDGDDVIVTLETPFFNPEFVAPFIEVMATSYGRMFHQLTNFAFLDKYNYRAAYFMHKPQGPVELYEKLLRCPVYFEQEEYRFVFDVGVMHEKVHNADNAVLDALVNTISQAVGREQFSKDAPIKFADVEETLADEVRYYVRTHLSNGLPDASTVAKAIGMSLSTFKRRLKAEGVTYRDLTQELRIEIAKDLLTANALSIYEISFMLGFSSSTAFSRAFKAWTGDAPSRYRQ